jgi:8-amino-7-oxononanoate synthase
MPNPKTGLQSLPVVATSNPTIDELNLKPVDPFHGYFKPNDKTPELDNMIECRTAFRWFRNIQEMISNGEYTWQQTMSGKSGPEVFSNNRTLFMLSSYDYLGLVGHPYIETATINAVRHYGTGTGGARMLAGTNQLHRQLEKKIVAFKRKPAALACSSGYMANLAVISCIIQKKDRVIVDELAHRSLIDALNMAQVPFQKFKHNNTEHLKSLLEKPTDAEKTFIVIEGIYSMEGDICALPEIIELKKEHNAYIILDESHSFGLLGRNGRGVDEHFGISPDDIDIYTSALSKSIPSGGGFIAASEQTIIFLQHAASAFVFSSAISPMNTAAALAGIEVIEKEGPERIQKLYENANYLRRNLKRLGYNTGLSESGIVPVIIGDTEKTLHLSAKLYQLGILANPVIFPAIPPGGDRLRLCVTAAQSKYMLDEVIYAFSLCTDVALSRD